MNKNILEWAKKNNYKKITEENSSSVFLHSPILKKRQ